VSVELSQIVQRYCNIVMVGAERRAVQRSILSP